MTDIAGMDQKCRLYRQGFYLRNRLAERCGRVRVCRLMKPEMRIADLYKGKLILDERAGGGVADRPEPARYAAADRPENACSSPGHAFQQPAAVHARVCAGSAIGMIAHTLLLRRMRPTCTETGDAVRLFAAT